MGQHFSETSSEAVQKGEFVQWVIAELDRGSVQYNDFRTWFDTYHTIQDGGVHIRASLGLLGGAYILRTKKRKLRRCHPIHPCLRTDMSSHERAGRATASAVMQSKPS